MYILYLQNYENKMRSFCVEIVQTGVHYLTAFSMLMVPLSPLAFPIDIKVCFQNIMCLICGQISSSVALCARDRGGSGTGWAF